MASEVEMQAVPSETVVGPYRYKIDFDDEAAYDYNFLGVCLGRSRRIKLDPRQSDTELPQTFVHELIHALGQAYDIDAWRHHTTNKDDEIIDKIDLMATAFLQWMRENPQAIKWLQESR